MDHYGALLIDGEQYTGPGDLPLLSREAGKPNGAQRCAAPPPKPAGAGAPPLKLSKNERKRRNRKRRGA